MKASLFEMVLGYNLQKKKKFIFLVNVAKSSFNLLTNTYFVILSSQNYIERGKWTGKV